MVNECLYDEKTALRTGQGTALVESLERPGFAIPITNLCS